MCNHAENANIPEGVDQEDLRLLEREVDGHEG